MSTMKLKKFDFFFFKKILLNMIAFEFIAYVPWSLLFMEGIP